VFYLLVSTGTAINIHYCGKKVQKFHYSKVMKNHVVATKWSQIAVVTTN
jgi:hypothetical protein